MGNYQTLIGRKWEYGVFDCFSLVRDYYKLLGIQLPDFKRPERYETCKSIFLKEANNIGFAQIDFKQRRPHDVLIMNLGTREPMHGAVLVDYDRILHQKSNSLSCVEPLNSYYRKATVASFRYASKSCITG